MVFSFSLPNPTFESTNPRDYMNAVNQNLLAQAIANQTNAVKARYEEPKTLEELTKSRLGNAHQELINKYYGPNIESEIGERNANASHLGAETNKLNQMLPGELLAQALGNRQKQYNLEATNINSPFNKQYSEDYKKNLQQAILDSQNAQSMDNYIDQFKNAYDKSTYKGTGVFGSGATPTTGISAGVRSLFHDFTPEQEADTASQNLQRSMISLLKTNRLTNYELKFLENLKLNRSMTPGAVNDLSKYLKAANERVNEYPKFLLEASHRGINPQEAELLFNIYKEQNPVINPKTNKVVESNLNSWQRYLDPEKLKDINLSNQISGRDEPSAQEAYEELERRRSGQ